MKIYVYVLDLKISYWVYFSYYFYIYPHPQVIMLSFLMLNLLLLWSALEEYVIGYSFLEDKQILLFHSLRVFRARWKGDSSTFKFLVRLVRKSWVKHPNYEVSRFLVSCFPTDVMRFIEKTSGTKSERALDTKMQINKANTFGSPYVGINFKIACYSFFAHWEERDLRCCI